MQKHPELPQAFADLGVEAPFLRALAKINFTTPSPIQEQLIPAVLGKRDVLGQARTGTGKTAAFGLPVLQRIDPAGPLQAICLAPTRELAVQITGELQRLASTTSLHIAAVYGGQKVATQLHKLGKKPHFVVGTPGRVMDFMGRRVLQVDTVRFAVLDEVDRMLDIGFRDDIREILGRLPADRQTIFVSATIDEDIRKLALRYMRDPVEINVSRDKMTVDEVDQWYITVEAYDKFRLLQMILDQEDPPVLIVFTNTKHTARKLTKKLHDAGIPSLEIHGDLDQRKRDRVMDKFRKNQVRVLVATDLAARGIDVSSITHIINYDVPKDREIYVHRIGRTARMGRRGVAITFVTREQGEELTRIEKLINQQIPARHVEGFKPSEGRDRLPPPPPVRPSVGAAASHSSTPASATTSVASKALPRTLGGRFPTRRSRRR